MASEPTATAAMSPTSLTQYDPAVEVSVIVVNWNGRDHLETCITSLQGQTLTGVEIVLVDNGSTDGSIAFVRQRFGNAVRIIEHSTNLGYGQALNDGIRTARGRYLFCLNNDTEVDAHCLAALVSAADQYPQAGSFAPKILSFSNRTIIDNVGQSIYLDGLSRGRGRLESDRGQYDRAEDVLLPSGCAMLLRREMLADVGLFDEDLFAYCEDTDLGLRAQLRGWTARFVPDAIVYHKYSASTDSYSPTKAFLVERNHIWVAVKCLPGPFLLFSPVFTLARLFVQGIGVITRRGAAGRFATAHSEARLLGILARALGAGLRGLPQAWRKRRALQRRRTISVATAAHWFTRHGIGLREIALKD
jgi:GT2 family glycosyltransferase